MLLLGVLLNYFGCATGMILFSIIQLFANGWRVLQWRRYVLWPILGWYVVGAAISFAGMWRSSMLFWKKMSRKSPPTPARIWLIVGGKPVVDVNPRHSIVA